MYPFFVLKHSEIIFVIVRSETHTLWLKRGKSSGS
jgi:hypothetical protein